MADLVLTPIKVRGKRHGKPIENAKVRRRRNPSLRVSRGRGCTFQATGAARPSPHALTSMSMQDTGARLESLPPEIVQLIFGFSLNLDLPLVSRRLNATLSRSSHLQFLLTTRIMRSVLGEHEPTALEITNVARLFDCRFMTWPFFTRWLRQHSIRHSLVDHKDFSLQDWATTWLELAPSPEMLPPRKLLVPPFTEEGVNLLTVLSQNMKPLAGRDTLYEEVARHGLAQAVAQNEVTVVKLLFSLGLDADTELLRQAVMQDGCNEDMIRALVGHPRAVQQTSVAGGEPSGRGHIDFLDPAVWSWAERLETSKASWLKNVLLEAQRVREQQ